MIFPPHMVASQLKILMPVGTEIAMVVNHEESIALCAHAYGEHVVRPDGHAQEPDRHRGRHHDRIAEDCLPREDRNNFGDESERGDHEDVDLRMAENPEEMHPDDGGTSGLRVKEVPAEIAVNQQHDLRGGEGADGEQHQAGHDEIEPGEQRHFAEGHSGAAHGNDGGDDVDRGADAAETGDQQAQSPEIGAVAGRECQRSQRRIGKPAHVRSVAGAVEAVGPEQAEIKEKTSECGEPEAESVQARESHVSRADHQREADS